MRFEGRERVCAHFRMRARECIQKRRLPGTRKADKSHVGYHLEFESEVKTLARFPFLRIHRRRVRRRAEMEVPPAAESAVRDEKLFSFFRELVHVAGISIRDDSADRDLHHEIFTAFAVEEPRRANLAVFGLE